VIRAGRFELLVGAHLARSGAGVATTTFVEKVVPGEQLHGAVFFPRLSGMGEKVDPEELVAAAAVQAILRLSHPSTVTTYLKRYPDFPQPVVDLSASRVRLWKRQDIVRWQKEREGRRD